jgi:hypothetical protein
MPRKATIEEVICKANQVHNNFYSYEKFIYTSNSAKSIITCPLHGDFNQQVCSHLSGKGCPICGQIKGTLAITETIEGFKSKLLKIHNNDLDFSIVGNYVNSHTPILLEKDSILYEMMPCTLLKGAKPSLISCIEKDKFIISKFKEIHKERYLYDKVKYKSYRDLVTVTCKVHGDFNQKVYIHLDGSGCQSCAQENRQGWNATSWGLSGSNSSNFKNFTLYIVEFYNHKERFLKIGITYKDIKSRLETIPYRYKELFSLTSERPEQIITLEGKLHKHYNKYRYKPATSFAGMYECFDISLNVSEVISYLSTQTDLVIPPLTDDTHSNPQHNTHIN